ncbi:MAG: hypothetical protein AAB491_00445 [Patescibacteria group bacterium]
MIKNNKDQEKISIRDNYSKGELSKEILKGLAIGGLIVASFALPNLPQVFSLLGIKNARDRYRIKRTIKNLESRKLVNFYEKGEKQILEITEKGRKKILEYKLDEMKIIRPKKWDGYWRMVSFDIPERYKRGRDALVKKLKDMEIYPLQKSVYICPFEYKDEIDFIGEIFGVGKFIHYFIIKELDNKDKIYLKDFYNL